MGSETRRRVLVRRSMLAVLAVAAAGSGVRADIFRWDNNQLLTTKTAEPSADLSGLNLDYAQLTGADLTGANLSGSTLSSALLVNATLTGADFTNATLTSANFDGATLPSQLPTLPVVDGATVNVTQALQVDGALALASTGTLNISAATQAGSLSGNGTVMMAASLNAGSDNTSTTYSGILSGGSLTKSGTGSLTLSGFLNNADLVATVDAGTLVLNKTSLRHPAVTAVGGSLTLNGGTVQLAGSGGNQIDDVAPVTVDAGTFDLNGRNETIGELSGAGGVITNSASGTTGVLTFGDAGDSSYAGSIQNGAPDAQVGLAKVSTGTFTLAGISTYSGPTPVSQGTLRVAPGGGLGGGTAITNDGVFEANGNAAVGAIDGSGTTIVGDGTNPASLSAPQIRQGTLEIRAGATVSLEPGAAGSPTVSIVSGLSLDAAGLLDLATNDLVLDYSGATPQGTFANLLASGAIFTSQLHPAPGSDAAIALVDNAMLHLTNWHGASISDGIDFSQLLFAYTYAGDTNLDGRVDASDYYNVIGNMGLTGAGWFDGDLNGDGTVSGADLAIVDANLGAGSAPDPTLAITTLSAKSSVPVMAVPEPALPLLALGAGLVLLRRRRSSARGRAQ